MKKVLLILFLLLSSVSVFSQKSFDERLKNLVLTAKVLETEIVKSDEKYPSVKLKLEVTFTNKGNEPIIFFPPFTEFTEKREFMFSCGISIFGRSPYGNYPIQGGCALPSNCGGCNEDLVKLLDQESPPENYTRILKPKESFTLIEESLFGLPLKKSNGMYGWDEIAENNWKIDGDVTYSMFPINLGKYGGNFGHKLQKRWQKHGILYVGDNHSLITSERFEIDLTGMKF